MEIPKSGIAGALAVIFCTAGYLAAANDAQPPVVLKSTTRLVLVDVIAKDRKDKPVAGLRQDDFQLRVDGKLQPLRVFAMNSASGSGALAASVLPANVFTNRLPEGPDSPSAATIIVLDTLNTFWTDQLYAKAQIVKYLRTLQPGDHIGLYTLGDNLRVVHDYTSNAKDLLSQLSAPQGKDLLGEVGAVEYYKRFYSVYSPLDHSEIAHNRMLGTLHVFEHIAQHLAQIPGRKNLVWVTGAFPASESYGNPWKPGIVSLAGPQAELTAELNRTMRAVNDANIAIYPVDARGVIGGSGYDASHKTIGTNALFSPVSMGNPTMTDEVALRTGGLAYSNRNDLSRAIENAVDDSRVTYTMGFYAVDGQTPGQLHDIALQVTGRSDIRLRYRKNYFDKDAPPTDEKTRKADLGKAVWSPLDASGLGLTAEVEPHAAGAQVVDIKIRVDHSGISLQPDQDHWKGKLDLVFVQRDDRGFQYEDRADTINLDLSADKFQQLMAEDFTYHQQVKRSPRAQLIRIVVRDASSGATGTVTIPVAKL